MKLHTPSIMKAGGIAAGVSILLGILSVIPILGCLLAPLTCIGGFLVPFGAGLGYGYFAPGKENTMEGVVGGLLTGIVSGVIYGTLYGLGAFLVNDFSTAAMLLVGSVIGAAIFGGMMGALGGLVWPQIQNMVEGRR
jgi:hypothetical protein